MLTATAFAVGTLATVRHGIATARACLAMTGPPLTWMVIPRVE
jgi:hypothetical protein